MYCLGIDMVEIARIERVLARWGDRFLHRVYTKAEIQFCQSRLPELAARFAAKEAVMKALGTGNRGIAWREIEILPNQRGRPLIYLHSRAQHRAQELGSTNLVLSLTHTRDFAIASVVGGTP